MEQKNRILIVEDDTDINNLLYTALQKAGYETVQAFSGTEARMLFQMDKAGFSLILLDLMLPGISGEEVYGTWVYRPSAGRRIPCGTAHAGMMN